MEKVTDQAEAMAQAQEKVERVPARADRHRDLEVRGEVKADHPRDLVARAVRGDLRRDLVARAKDFHLHRLAAKAKGDRPRPVVRAKDRHDLR